MAGTLFLVATPIGNLEDMTARALRVLQEVSFIVCEDTRHSRGLLTHFGISKPTLSLPAFAEGQRAGNILDRIEAGQDCALITDAGSPAISDPGEKLVAEAVARKVDVVPVPGPSAVIAALSGSGLPTGRFCFVGFLPRQGSDRRSWVEELSGLSGTLVLFESSNRLAETLSDLTDMLGNRRACVARELTKIHEQFVRGTLSELTKQCTGVELRGEVVILVQGREEQSRWTEQEVRAGLEQGLERGERLKELSTEVARLSGWMAKEIYRLGLTLKGETKK